MQAFDHDLCLSFFGQSSDAGMFDFPPGAKVLEVGCAEADWSTPMKAVRPDLHITSIDVRDCKRPGSDVLIKGDVLGHDFEPHSFDAIVSVSTIEHIGLGAYGDPKDSDGDSVAMQRLLTWLKPGGFLYFDVPYRPVHQTYPKFRAYDDQTLASRLLPGWKERARMVFLCQHPDAPYIALTVEPA